MRDSSVLGPPRRRGIFRGQRGLEFRVCGPVSFAVSRESRRHGDTAVQSVCASVTLRSRKLNGWRSDAAPVPGCRWGASGPVCVREGRIYCNRVYDPPTSAISTKKSQKIHKRSRSRATRHAAALRCPEHTCERPWSYLVVHSPDSSLRKTAASMSSHRRCRWPKAATVGPAARAGVHPRSQSMPVDGLDQA